MMVVMMVGTEVVEPMIMTMMDDGIENYVGRKKDNDGGNHDNGGDKRELECRCKRRRK